MTPLLRHALPTPHATATQGITEGQDLRTAGTGRNGDEHAEAEPRRCIACPQARHPPPRDDVESARAQPNDHQA